MTLYFDEAMETLPREQLAAVQLKKLQVMLADIYGRNRFYTKKFTEAGFYLGDLKSLVDLQYLPLTNKIELSTDQVAEGFTGANLTYPLTAYTRYHQTSGTSGQPLRVFDTVESWDWWGRCWAHVFAGAGVTAQDRIFFAFSFGPFIGFWAAVEGARQIGAMLIPGGGRSSIERLHLMRDTGSTVLCCTPTYALHLLEVAREQKIPFDDFKIRATIHAGEPGANVPATKARIEEGWSAKCYDHAGASEVGGHSFECQAQPNGIHVIESEFIVECLNPTTSQPVAPGEKGELVITNLGRWGFPVIRYHTGDAVIFNEARCECGRTFLRLEGGVLGRVDDMVTIRGVNIFPSAIENLVRIHSVVDEFQVKATRRGELDELCIEIELVEDVNSETVSAAIAQSISSTLGLRPLITTVPRGTLPRFELKAKRFHYFG
ncbi:MAG: phenylacetate--CoA ligase family protein [Anaerolineae bacterium]|nr:phenylacetate--CoA ligase family protein [Anaerolineae bacterium]MCQ3975590.1 phenylacetate--CoA ligase family protein [Anaerolineae bacterium]